MATRARKRKLVREGRMDSDGEKLYRLSTIADMAGLAVRTVETHVQKGALKIVRVGPARRPRVRESEMKRYLGLEGDDR